MIKNKNKYTKHYEWNEWYEELLDRLSSSLNEIHGVCYSKRYWRILVGPWLGSFLKLVFEFWICHQSGNLMPKQLKIKSYYIPSNMNDYMKLFTSDDWLEAVESDVINIIKNKKIENEKELILKYKNESIFANLIARYVNLINRFLSSDTDYFIHSRYLSKLNIIKIYVLLKQFPVYWVRLRRPIKIYNDKLRSLYYSDKKVNGKFIDSAELLIYKYIPIAYLEGFECLMDYAINSGKPKNPMGIFLDSGIYEDDELKLWVANNCEKGVPLFIYQHGGSYGIAKYNFHEKHEVEICDKYLNWGWSDDEEKHIEAGFLHSLESAKRKKKSTSILYIMTSAPKNNYYYWSAPDGVEWNEYINFQISLISELSKNVRDKILLRLNPEDYKSNTAEKILNHFPLLSINNKKGGSKKLLLSANMVICSYNSTAFLESLFLNIPTIAFWDSAYWRIRNEADLYLRDLERVGIYHSSAIGAATKINEIAERVNEWWFQDDLQNIRSNFVNRYVKKRDNIPDFLSNIFNSYSGKK